MEIRHAAGKMHDKSAQNLLPFSYAGIIRFRYVGMISAQQDIEHPLVKVGAKLRFSA